MLPRRSFPKKLILITTINPLTQNFITPTRIFLMYQNFRYRIYFKEVTNSKIYKQEFWSINMEHIDRRRFMRMATGLVIAAATSRIIIPGTANAGIPSKTSSPIYKGINPDGSSYKFKAPTTREEIYHIPKIEVLASAIGGEGNSCILSEQYAIGHTPFNRGKDGRRFNGEGDIVKVLLKQIEINGKLHNQYDCFNDTDPRLYQNFLATLDPRSHDPKSHKKNLETAKKLLNGFEEHNLGQTIYITKKTVSRWERTGESPLWFKRLTELIIPNSENFKHKFYLEPHIIKARNS
jgi:hypothetical protein